MNEIGCFNCSFFRSNGSAPQRHIPGLKYSGACQNSARPLSGGYMSVVMVAERPGKEICAYHSAAQQSFAADAATAVAQPALF